MGQAMTKPAASSAAGEGQYVTLGIEHEVFAVPVESVLEILDMRRVSRIPEAPPYMLGLLDLRGRSVPVLDLRVKLGLPPQSATDTTRILVVEVIMNGRAARSRSRRGPGYRGAGHEQRRDRAASGDRRALAIRVYKRRRPPGRKLHHHLRSAAPVLDGGRGGIQSQRGRRIMSLALRRVESSESATSRDARPVGGSAGYTDHLSARDFDRLARFIHFRSGIKMPAGKKTMLEARLRRRVLALGMASFADYCRYLFERGGLDKEATDLIDAVTTNKTDFFREAEHFRFLTEKAVPALVAEAAT